MKNKKSQKGLILVFIVLCSQILIFCLAMVINIGLVVHDKINLQNSVDLGAIYGAQKQAEILDAMAHVNYQMRQSYKLFVWRYLVLGSSGSQHKPGKYSIVGQSPDPEQASCHALRRSGSAGPCLVGLIQEGASPYVACFDHPYWNPNKGDRTNNCQNALSGIGRIPALQVFGLHASELRSTAIRTNLALDNNCNSGSLISWITTTSFYHILREDLKNRKKLIESLYLLLQGGLDISGDKIEEGIKNTIRNNLTFINYINLKDDDIKIRFATSGSSFPSLFRWNTIQPIPFYLNRDDSGPSRVCEGNVSHLRTLPSALGRIYSNDADKFKILIDSAEKVTSPIDIGFYKKSVEDFSVQIKIEMDYEKQMFLPFSRPIKMVSSAGAKAFGGKFGPQPNADQLLPAKILSGSQFLSPDAFLNLPNYSRYPGDTLGLLAMDVQYHWQKYLTDNFREVPISRDVLKTKGLSMSPYLWHTGLHDPIVRYWDEPRITNKDKQSAPNTLRQYEEAAIAPDIFDAYYYSILPNYMTTLYPKIRDNQFLKSRDPNAILLGDLGHYVSSSFNSPDTNWRSRAWNESHLCELREPFRLNYIEKQIACSWYYLKGSQLGRGKIEQAYFLTHLDQVLTSWMPPGKRYTAEKIDQRAYEQNPIGKCHINDTPVKIDLIKQGFKVNTPTPLIPSHCLQGGRTGFSVVLTK